MAKKNAEENAAPFDSMIEGGGVSPEAADAAEEAVGINSLVLYSEAPELDKEDLLIPRLRLAQGLTQEVQDGVANPGQWVLTGFEPSDELTVVPLGFKRQRELRDDDFQVLCSSPDAITGFGEPGGSCASCPMNHWGKDERTGKGIPPKCTFSYSYMVYVVELDTPAIVDFKKTSLQAGKLLNTMVAQRGMARFGVRLKAIRQTGKRGTYHQTSIQPTSVGEDVLEKAAMLFQN